jgi:hypothetical protein
MSQVVVVKLPTGSQPPIGYSFVRSTRNVDIYHKLVTVVTPAQVDELSDLFGMFGMENVALIPQDTESDFLNAFAGLSVGGKRSRRHKRKSKKTKRKRY